MNIPEEQIFDLIDDSQNTINEIKKLINLFRFNEATDDINKVISLIEEKNRELLKCKKYKDVKKILKVKKVATRGGFKSNLLSDYNQIRKH